MSIPASHRPLLDRPLYASLGTIRPDGTVPVNPMWVETIDDPAGDFHVRLGRRYGNPAQQPPPGKADRVILVMGIEKVNSR